jgi:hypothetical protein
MFAGGRHFVPVNSAPEMKRARDLRYQFVQNELNELKYRRHCKKDLGPFSKLE